MTDAQFLQVITLITTVCGFGVAEYRANRARRWAKEDAEQRAAEAKSERTTATEQIIATAKAEAEATRIRNEAAAETLRIQTALHAAQLREEQRLTAEELRQHTSAATAEIKTEVSAARQEAAEAYKEANGVNLKLETLSRTAIAAAAGRRREGVIVPVLERLPHDHKPEE